MQRLTETLAALTDVLEADWQIALARWLIVSCFLLNGLFNCVPHRVTEHVQRLQQFGTPLALPIFWAGIAMQLLSCSLIILGWQARLGVIGLMLFLLLATLLFHRFWRMPDAARRNLARINVMNNCAIFGGLLLLLQHTSRG